MLTSPFRFSFLRSPAGAYRRSQRLSSLLARAPIDARRGRLLCSRVARGGDLAAWPRLADMASDNTSWRSLWSRNSLLSIGSESSILSIGSIGSVLSVGSVGSFASFGKPRIVRGLPLHRIGYGPRFGDVVSVDGLGDVVPVDSSGERPSQYRIPTRPGWRSDHSGCCCTRLRLIPDDPPGPTLT